MGSECKRERNVAKRFKCAGKIERFWNKDQKANLSELKQQINKTRRYRGKRRVSEFKKYPLTLTTGNEYRSIYD